MVKKTCYIVIIKKEISNKNRLFVVHPEYKPMFKAFANVPDDQLADNRRFQVHTTWTKQDVDINTRAKYANVYKYQILQAHAINVLTNINMLIDSLDDVECLVEHLQTIKERHAPRKVTAIHFQVYTKWRNLLNKTNKR